MPLIATEGRLCTSDLIWSLQETKGWKDPFMFTKKHHGEPGYRLSATVIFFLEASLGTVTFSAVLSSTIQALQ